MKKIACLLLTTAALFLFPSALYAKSYATSFQQTENPLSETGNWIQGGSTGLDWTNTRASSTYVFGTQPGFSAGVYDDSISHLTGTWGANQTMQATVHITSCTTSGNTFEELELLGRFTIAAHSAKGYETNFRCAADGSQYIGIVKWLGPFGMFTELTSTVGPGMHEGDVVRMTVTGTSTTTINVYVNNMVTPVLTINDTSSPYTTGNPGLGFFLQNNTGLNANYGFYSWAASDVGITNATDCTSAAVDTAEGSATNGSAVYVPNGSCSWSTVVSMTHGITLYGNGIGRTVITDSAPGENVLTWACASGQAHRMTGLGFVDGGVALVNKARFLITCSNVASTTMRIDNNKFDHLGDFPFWTYNTVGVFDHNIVLSNGSKNFVYDRLDQGTHGDASWNSALSPITNQDMLYIENNVITWDVATHYICFDAFGGARLVFRFNTLTRCVGEVHGTDTAGRDRGTRWAEFYANTMDATNEVLNTMMTYRSGSGFVWGNVWTNVGTTTFNQSVGMVIDRATGAINPWGSTSGFSPLDVNDAGNPFNPGAFCPSNICTVTTGNSANTGVITVATASWTPSQWVTTGPAYLVSKVGCLGISVCNSVITANGTNTITFGSCDGHCGPTNSYLQFGIGDQFKIVRITHALDQPARGFGSLLTSISCSSINLSGTTATATCAGHGMVGTANAVIDANNTTLAGPYSITVDSSSQFHYTTTAGASNCSSFCEVTPLPAGWNNQTTEGIYEWNNTINGTLRHVGPNQNCVSCIENTDYFNYTTSFTGATGVGIGTALPATCAVGTFIFKTDEGNWNLNTNTNYIGQGQGYKCGPSANQWTLAYVPLTFPHPLTRGDAAITPPDLDAPVPGASGAITSASVSYTTLTLNWTAATDAVTPQSSLQYQVYRSTSNNINTVANAEANGTIALAYTANITTANLTGLTSGTTYFFNVIVRDAALNKAVYVTRTDTTLPSVITQTSFRCYADDAAVNSTTAIAAENAGCQRDKSVNFQLRIQAATSGTVAATTFTLQFKKTTDSTWVTIPTPPVQVTTTITATGAGTWTAPAFTTTAQVDCWSGGGAGAQSSTNTTGRAGGGAGAWARRTYSGTIVPATAYNYTVGIGGTSGASPVNGGNTNFTGPGAVQCLAGGATSASANSSTATAGSTTHTGDSTANGGAGANGVTITSGGGGEAGGPNGVGTSASGATGGTGHASAGDGGNGTAATANTVGGAGAQPGGGGAGGKRQNATTLGGAGGAGEIIIVSTPIPPADVALSANIPGGGAATTARLSVPGGKTFFAGIGLDDSATTGSFSIPADQYSEYVWNLSFTADSVYDDVYQFRLVKTGAVVFDTYTNIPTVTVHTPPAPALSNLSPSSGTRSTAPTITITGTALDGASPSLTVSGTGITPSGFSASNSTTATATFTIASNATLGSHNVQLTTVAGASNNLPFTVTALPTFTSLSPSTGLRNQSTPVTLTGTNFDIANLVVNVGGCSITVNNTVVVNATTVTANFLVASNASVGFCNISVTTDGGTSGNQSFLVSGGLTLTNLTPTSQSQGVTGTVLTLTGTGFSVGLSGGTPTVDFNASTGITVTNVNVVNDTQILATINIASNATASDRAVTVTTDEGTSTEKTFTVVTPPTQSGGVSSRARFRKN